MYEAPPIENYSEQRKVALKAAIEVLREKELLEELEAVVLFGSTARGDATETSDIDIFCITKDGKALNKAETIIATVSEKIPGVEIQISGGSRDDVARFVSRKSHKTGKEASWEILFSQNHDADQEISDLIRKTQLKA